MRQRDRLSSGTAAVLQVEGVNHPCTVIDISAAGALLGSRRPAPAEVFGTISLSVAGERIQLGAYITRRESASRFAVVFSGSQADLRRLGDLLEEEAEELLSRGLRPGVERRRIHIDGAPARRRSDAA
jgi:hypothetical protein